MLTFLATNHRSHRQFLVQAIAVILVLSSTTQIACAQKKPLLSLPRNIAPKDRICFALYTVHESTLKLTAQFYPLKNSEPFHAQLQVMENGKWVSRASSDIAYPGYTATFRVENWDDTQAWEYRVAHHRTAFYQGTIQKNPRDNPEFVMAAFTGNAIYPPHGGDISRADIIKNLKKLKPDLLFFSGDQVYDHSEHYLYWLKFGRDFGELIRNTPTICIPDDHDVGQANLWGEGGKRSNTRRGHMGGYYMPVSYVQEVERAQTSHLPDPYDPTPIERGIGVYYTDLKWGGLSFAILEDRKFKTGPGPYVSHQGKPTEAISEPGHDTRKFDITEAKLLGDRQLKFLEAWTTDWEDAEMKAVLSQTIFAQGCNYSGKHEKELLADFDSNGWPQTGRNKAVAVIRKSFSCMIAGDQHLATVIHHGIDDWNDSGYSFCVPSIANYWLRWWDPKQPGKNRQPGSPNYTGEFLDGFQNKITMHAVANPTAEEKIGAGKLSTRAAGFGIVKFNKPARSITFECWPRNVDITNADSKQYAGWPITIRQADNYPLKNGLQLPTLKVSNPRAVVTVLEESSGGIVSSQRINGATHQPRVPGPGKYSLIVGEGQSQKTIGGQEAQQDNRQLIDLSSSNN